VNAEAIKADLREATERALSFLRELSFEFTGVSENTLGVLGIIFEGTWTNRGTNRIVRVTYIPKGDGLREVAVTAIRLVVPEPAEWDDYTSTGGMRVCTTNLTELPGALAVRFGQHLRDAEHLLRGKFMPVLLGQDWRSDHLDWGGLK
jgi:hypothetical protein